MAEEYIEDLKARQYQTSRSYNASQSPLRHAALDDLYLEEPTSAALHNRDSSFFDYYDPDASLRLKWMDNSPRMSRLREHRQKRLINRLEQFELWDIEQEKKHKQYDLAREQRYKTIVERLKSQEFCVNLMKKRHESDLETSRELETYSNDHLYFDALDDPKTQYKGPVSQYRKFQNEMDSKLRTLQHDIDNVNPRHRIVQTILPRLERTKERYSVDPDVFTKSGRRVLKKPTLEDLSLKAKDVFATPVDLKLKPIIHAESSPRTSRKYINFH